MDVSKMTLVGIVALLPVTAGLAVATGLLYREADRNRAEIAELKRTVLTLHGMAIPNIPSPKKPETNIPGDAAKLPVLPVGDIKVPITGGKTRSSDRPSAGELQEGGDRIKLMDGDGPSTVQKKPDVTLIDEGKNE